MIATSPAGAIATAMTRASCERSRHGTSITSQGHQPPSGCTCRFCLFRRGGRGVFHGGGCLLVAQKILELLTRPAYPALDRACRDPADLASLLVREAGGADKDQCLALLGIQLLERGAQVTHSHMPVLRRLDGQICRHLAVDILDLAFSFAQFGIICVAQDREQPCTDIRSRLKALLFFPGLDQRLLHQILGTNLVADQGSRKCAEGTDGLDEIVTERIRSEEHTSELQSRGHLVCRLLLEKKKT